MSNNKTGFYPFVLATGACLSWFAIIVQFVLMLQSRQTELLTSLTRFFSYFTILSNILVALYFTWCLFAPNTTFGKLLNRYSSVTIITAYILVVGIVYNLVLRQIWAPQGWGKVADELLHSVIPFFYLLFWLFLARKERVDWHVRTVGLVFPFAYFAYTLIRGAIVHWYPYPFVDVTVLGYQNVLFHCLIIGIFFYLLLTLLIFISRKRN